MRNNSIPTTLHILAKTQFGGIAGLARACGLSSNTVFRAARGDKVSYETRRRIRKAFGGTFRFALLQKSITDVIMESAEPETRSRRNPLVARFKVAPDHLTPAEYSQRGDIREAESSSI